jgi:rare lipoprotein A (peptidoglycan hydrolase)
MPSQESFRETVQPLVRRAAARAGSVTELAADTRRLLAQAGVAVFSLSLVLPTIVHGAAQSDVLVASSVDEQQSAYVEERISLPNFREPVPTPDPTTAPTSTLAPTSPSAVVAAGGPAVLITASWYGPGFYDNRLPCWQWLQANGLPIQFEPDTWGVAHKTLPCGTMLTLSHGANSITVPVVDRGPYVAGREIDLSPRVKAALGCTDLCSVVMQVK